MSLHTCKLTWVKEVKITDDFKKPQHVPLFKHRYICSRKMHNAYLDTQLMLHKSRKIIYNKRVIINYKITQHLQLYQVRHIKNRYTPKEQFCTDVK